MINVKIDNEILNSILSIEKNKDSLEQIEKVHESSIKKIIDDISKLSEEKIEKELNDYNKNFTDALNRQITSSKIQLNEKKNEINDKIADLGVKQNSMIKKLINQKKRQNKKQHLKKKKTKLKLNQQLLHL